MPLPLRLKRVALAPWPRLLGWAALGLGVLWPGWQLLRAGQPELGYTALLALVPLGLGLALLMRRPPARPAPQRDALRPLLFEQAQDGIVVFDDTLRVLACNDAAGVLFGRPAARAVGRPLTRWLPSDALAPGRREVLVGLPRPGGVPTPCELSVSPLPGAAGAPRFVGMLRDLSERRAAERRMRVMADFDSLTGLPNRHLFRDRLGRALERAARAERRVALMFLDLDRFKHINDSLGHDTGDRLLQHVAMTLTSALRGTDSVARGASGDDDPFTVARLGGDEFTVVVEDLHDIDEVRRIAERLLAALERPFHVDTHELVVTGSIGITVYPDDASPAEDLLKHADLAMYRAKDAGRNAVHFYSDEMNEHAQRRLQLEADLRHALERGEFVLMFQPKADVQTQRVSGVEALLRWQRDGREVAPPDVFVPILEDTGLILAVGEWVLAQAAQQVCAWRRAGLPWLPVAVNLSARQLRQGDIVATVAAVLETSGLPSAQLELELTESMLMDGHAHARTLARLSALGVQLAIDDFGTGYSSLSYLKRFNLDTLKIDRSFVQDMPNDLEDNAIAVAVIALARSLKLRVVAEGVETQAQRQYLLSLGCDEMQGWLLSQALPAAAFEAWWRAQLGLPAADPALDLTLA